MIRRLRGTAAILRALPAQRRIPYLQRERLEELRDRRLRETVAVAARTPYYRALFRAAGVDPRELRTAGDLAALPLVERSAMTDEPAAFRSPDAAPLGVTEVETSGRSGEPLRLLHDNASLLAGVAYAERQRAVEAHFAGQRYRYTVVEIRSLGSAVGVAQALYGRTSWRPLRPRTHVVPVEWALDDILAASNAARPHVLRTYGSYAEALFRVLDAERLPFTTPRVLLYGGDAMSPAARRFVEERFGIPVISVYSAVEAPRIGFTCEERSGFHLNEDLVHVRLVDDDGRDVPAGETGNVVLSNLVNRATVVLNYRQTGDVARFVDAPCSCGRTLRRLEGLEGRLAKVIRLPGGRLVHQYAIFHALFALEGLLNFQLVQREPLRFELRLQTAPSDYERVARAATVELARLLPGCAVDTAAAARLGVERQSGKFHRVQLLDGAQA